MVVTLAQDPVAIEGAINQITDFILSYLIALASVGAFSMAMIEAAKKVFALRERFHRRQVARWVGQWQPPRQDRPHISRSIRAGESPETSSTRDAAAGSDLTDEELRRRALADLLMLCTGSSDEESSDIAGRMMIGGRIKTENVTHKIGRHGPTDAMFAMSIERMMGSIQEAADAAINEPKRYPALYWFLASTAGRSAESWQENYEDRLRDAAAAVSPDSTVIGPNDAVKRRMNAKKDADLYSQLRLTVKRQLDGFQFYTAESWAFWNQVAANVVGIVVLFAVLSSLSDGPWWGASELAMNLAGSLLGGMLAPVAKDLVSMLKQVRYGQG